MSQDAIKLIIGLGNPDTEYANTYHNAGILFVKYLESHNPIGYWLVASGSYMNESGKFVKTALKKHNVKPEELLIAHDDSDLELGKYKIDFGRGAAGHHGVESIQQHLKTNDFWRLRIGIRPDTKGHESGDKHETPRMKAGDFVLKKISATDMATLKKVFEEIAEKLSSGGGSASGGK